MAYANSDHLFSQPIRYYKSNDPYYYEVDNIPIRQLEENVLWVKDQLETMLSPASGAEPQTGSPLFVGDDIDLEHIKQFRPKFIGGRNLLVQAGRFNARVNDAYNVMDSLARIFAEFLGAGCSNLPKITQFGSPSVFDGIWESYTSKLTTEEFASCLGESNTARAYRANGLETMFTFYISKNFGSPIATATTTTYGAPEYVADGTGRGKTWPALWHSDFTSPQAPNPETLGSVGARTDWSKLNEIHLKIVQHWRGVARTSVVDFRGDTIQVPPFDKYDYYYVEDVNGEEVVTSLEDLASQRIDLLVVYSHPIDASTTTLTEYSPNVSPVPIPGGAEPTTPKTIVEPRLGIIRGAGIGLKRVHSKKIELLDKRMYPGEQKILANLNDQLAGGSNTGIKLRGGAIIHGSFPSPDDLANIAPNLTLALEDTDIQLVGQTALPIAYIVVSKDSTNLTQDDIIDIRPFLRTTELAYNERAGIAAAQPALSFANPAVGAAQLDAVTKCMESRLTGIGASIAGNPITLSYRDAVMGGICFGQESCFLSLNDSTGGPKDQTAGGSTWAAAINAGTGAAQTNSRRQYLMGLYDGQVAKGGSFPLSRWCADTTTAEGTKGNYLDLPSDREIPFFPDWDLPIDETTTTTEIVALRNTASPGHWYNIATGAAPLPMGAVLQNFTQTGSRSLLITRLPFLKKKLIFKLPTNVNSYQVDAKFANCIPLTADSGQRSAFLLGGSTYIGALTPGLWPGSHPISLTSDTPDYGFDTEEHDAPIWTLNSDQRFYQGPWSIQAAQSNPLPGAGGTGTGGAFRNAPGGGEVFVNKTGIYTNADGDKVAEVSIIVPGVIVNNQGYETPYALWACWAAGLPQTAVGRVNQANLGFGVNYGSLGDELQFGSFNGAQIPDSPRPQIGASFFPTISFTLTGYENNTSFDPVVLGTAGKGLTGAQGNHDFDWIQPGGDVAPYNPEGTVIDLTSA